MKIGFIGLGIMGESMCENIVRKHDDFVYVFDYLKEKIELLESKGAIGCNSSKEVAQKSDVIITMVPKSEHSKAVYTEIRDVLSEEKVCIDMSTIDPKVSIEISNMIKETGAEFIDAPVVKSKPAAISGTLGIYVGGNDKSYEKVKPILSYMGENIKRMGENGKGLVMKICHNALVSQIQNGVNETIALADKFDIDVQNFTEAVSYGGGQNFYLDGKKNAISEENYETAFSVENMAKDIGICMNLAEQVDVSMPGESNVEKVYERALELGFGKEDFCATIKVVKGR